MTPAPERLRFLSSQPLALALGGVLLGALLVALVVRALGPDPVPRPDLDALPEGTLFGVHHRPEDRTERGEKLALEALESALGRRLDIDHSFYAWDKPFPTWRERWDLRGGRIPMISWNGRGAYASDIAAGHHDPLIAERAAGVGQLEHTVFIRWFWEMDGKKKSEWAQSPSDYVAAFRHIRQVFENESVYNVAWLWCPNASAFTDGRAQKFYPGPDDVDWICADGYNWAPGRSGDRWEGFAEIFAGFYEWASRQGKPLMIGEFGVQEGQSGQKAAWVRDATETIKTAFPRIRAVVYFDTHADYDWRMRTSKEAFRAFQEMATDPWFHVTRVAAGPH